jgi:hypothetical protein
MNQGFYLTLMLGPVVPTPASKDVVDALTSAEITVTAGQRSGFQLTFAIGPGSPLHKKLALSGSAANPIVRVVLIATINGTPEVLIDGVVTQLQSAPGAKPGSSTLTLTGEDLTALMDWINFDGFPYPNMPREARVALMVAKYAMFGIIPLVIPTVLIDVPLALQEIPAQSGTDLAYIQQLAAEVGYVFYLKPGPAPGTSFAYWGPEIKVGIPQPALNVNMDALTNVDSLSFSFDAQSAKLPVVLILNEESKLLFPIPVPDVTPLNPPLGLVPSFPKGPEYLEEVAKFGPVRAALLGLAKAARSSADVVTGTGSLDVLRYGRPLRARELVGVRGAGEAFDGLYYVKSVTHNIKRGEYKQNFSLARNGLISTLPRVPV